MVEAQIANVTESPEHMEKVRELFREYAAEIGIDLAFQGFEQELAELPGCYAAPKGCILLAGVEGEIAGCIAVRPLAERTCEVKRMYVKPAYRGLGVARTLVSEALGFATETRYLQVLLDTLESMKPARKLYESFGFRETDPYYKNPLPDVVFYELDLLACALDIVAASAHEIGEGRWGIVVHNDDEISFGSASVILNHYFDLSPDVAAALVQVIHFHGSAAAKRMEDLGVAHATFERIRKSLDRSSERLNIELIDLEAPAPPGE
ncbi:MAG: ATP-dependent Clp protease adaptor ClpS [Planctomycetes bacterium]|nr:ATP-dependent Clp protease adaptor ClpS [Pseudomonadales bacterium]MCB9894950.1 ATP-dependent Clp protease adaptor ClpS [Planctomycetota bacterium]